MRCLNYALTLHSLPCTSTDCQTMNHISKGHPINQNVFIFSYMCRIELWDYLFVYLSLVVYQSFKNGQNQHTSVQVLISWSLEKLCRAVAADTGDLMQQVEKCRVESALKVGWHEDLWASPGRLSAVISLEADVTVMDAQAAYGWFKNQLL